MVNFDALETVKSISSTVSVQADMSKDPVLVYIIDGVEVVSTGYAALQKENVIWMAEGYAKAKQRYENHLPAQSLEELAEITNGDPERLKRAARNLSGESNKETKNQ